MTFQLVLEEGYFIKPVVPEDNNTVTNSIEVV
jgi:hypothetical protein